MCREGVCGECRMKRWNERYLNDRFGYGEKSFSEMINKANSYEDYQALEDTIKDVELDEYSEFTLMREINKKRYLFE